MQHFLDCNGNIPETMPKEAKALAGFHALVVDAVTDIGVQPDLVPTDLRCFEKGCKGHTAVQIVVDDKIHWYCDTCDMGGIISEWQGTKFDNMR